MYEIRNVIEIDAPAAIVWEILADLPAYSEWNPFVRELDGRLAAGEWLRARFTPPGKREIRARVQITDLVPGKRLEWGGHMLVRGLCDGRHSFTIHERPDGGVRVEDIERFTGLLVPLVKRFLDAAKPGFVEADLALKQRAEMRGSSGPQGTRTQPGSER